MPKQDSAQLLQLREAFISYSNSQTKANQDAFRIAYLNYIRQLTTQISLPEKDDDIEFIQGNLIKNVFSAITTELSPCYTADARNQHFPTAALIPFPINTENHVMIILHHPDQVAQTEIRLLMQSHHTQNHPLLNSCFFLYVH